MDDRGQWHYPPGVQTYQIVNSPGSQIRISETAKNSNELILSTRSVLGTMAYLSQGVAVPEKHSQASLVSAGFAKEDANGIIPDLLQVRVQEERPKHASLIVPYKGYWFYIEESDISSKRTMGALNSLARLKIKAAAAQKIPVLTLPVAK